MTGIGSFPIGSTPFGFGMLVHAAVPAVPAPSPYATVAPRLDPASRTLVVENGNLVMADGVEQRVLLRLATDKGSAAVVALGNELRKIDRITDNLHKRVDTAVREALADMVTSNEIEIDKVTVEVVR